MPRDPDKEKKVMEILEQCDGRTVTLGDSSITVSIPSDVKDNEARAALTSAGLSFHREPQPDGKQNPAVNWYKIDVKPDGTP
jgi:hypothetical protein